MYVPIEFYGTGRPMRSLTVAASSAGLATQGSNFELEKFGIA